MDLLDDNHRRVVESTFSLLDEMLDHIERWALREEIHSALYKEINTLSDTDCTELMKQVRAIEEIIKKVKHDLDLKPHFHLIGKKISAMCTLFNVNNLLFLKGDDMNSYGETPKELFEYLNPIVEDLVKRLEHMADIGHNSMKDHEKIETIKANSLL